MKKFISLWILIFITLLLARGTNAELVRLPILSPLNSHILITDMLLAGGGNNITNYYYGSNLWTNDSSHVFLNDSYPQILLINGSVVPNYTNEYWLGEIGSTGRTWMGIKTVRIQTGVDNMLLISSNDQVLKFSFGTGDGWNFYLKALSDAYLGLPGSPWVYSYLTNIYSTNINATSITSTNLNASRDVNASRVCIGGDCQISWPSGGGNTTEEIQAAINNSGYYNISVNDSLFSNYSNYANNSFYAFGKNENQLNVNSSLYSNYSNFLEGFPASYFYPYNNPFNFINSTFPSIWENNSTYVFINSSYPTSLLINGSTSNLTVREGAIGYIDNILATNVNSSTVRTDTLVNRTNPYGEISLNNQTTFSFVSCIYQSPASITLASQCYGWSNFTNYNATNIYTTNVYTSNLLGSGFPIRSDILSDTLIPSFITETVGNSTNSWLQGWFTQLNSTDGTIITIRGTTGRITNLYSTLVNTTNMNSTTSNATTFWGMNYNASKYVNGTGAYFNYLNASTWVNGTTAGITSLNTTCPASQYAYGLNVTGGVICSSPAGGSDTNQMYVTLFSATLPNQVTANTTNISLTNFGTAKHGIGSSVEVNFTGYTKVDFFTQGANAGGQSGVLVLELFDYNSRVMVANMTISSTTWSTIENYTTTSLTGIHRIQVLARDTVAADDPIIADIGLILIK